MFLTQFATWLTGKFLLSPFANTAVLVSLVYLFAKGFKFARIEYETSTKYKKLPSFPYFTFIGAWILGNIEMLFVWFGSMRKDKGITAIWILVD